MIGDRNKMRTTGPIVSARMNRHKLQKEHVLSEEKRGVVGALRRGRRVVRCPSPHRWLDGIADSVKSVDESSQIQVISIAAITVSKILDAHMIETYIPTHSLPVAI
jgi:hypothetical protein